MWNLENPKKCLIVETEHSTNVKAENAFKYQYC